MQRAAGERPPSKGARPIQPPARCVESRWRSGDAVAARLGLLRERDEAISEGHRRNRSWAREHPDQRDGVWFKREIVPKLDAFSLKEIGRATGLSLVVCSRIRAGDVVPHPRH